MLHYLSSAPRKYLAQLPVGLALVLAYPLLSANVTVLIGLVPWGPVHVYEGIAHCDLCTCVSSTTSKLATVSNYYVQ